MAQASPGEMMEVIDRAMKVLKNTPLGQNQVHVSEIILQTAEALHMCIVKEVQSARDMGLIA